MGNAISGLVNNNPVTQLFGNAGSGGGGGFTSQLFNANGMFSPWQIATMDNGALDPLNLFPANKPGGINYQQKYGSPLPDTLPASLTSQPGLYDPNSFSPRTPSAPGIFNAMAARLAGPVYNPMLMGSQASPSAGTPGAAGGGGVPHLPFNPGNPVRPFFASPTMPYSGAALMHLIGAPIRR